MEAPGNLSRHLQATWTGAVALAQEKALLHAERSSNPERFMSVYDRTLNALNRGADFMDRRRLYSDVDDAAEAEALAAHRAIMSCVHPRQRQKRK